jgi:hypothetical protein
MKSQNGTATNAMLWISPSAAAKHKRGVGLVATLLTSDIFVRREKEDEKKIWRLEKSTFSNS